MFILSFDVIVQGKLGLRAKQVFGMLYNSLSMITMTEYPVCPTMYAYNKDKTFMLLQTLY